MVESERTKVFNAILSLEEGTFLRLIWFSKISVGCFEPNNNSFYAVNPKENSTQKDGILGSSNQPGSFNKGNLDKIQIRVKGQWNRDGLKQPAENFSTFLLYQTYGQGNWLGIVLSYDINLKLMVAKLTSILKREWGTENSVSNSQFE